MSGQGTPLFVAADTGPAFWGPGDRYTFLVTGEQSGGAYFILEALVPPVAVRRCSFTVASMNRFMCWRVRSP